jgi:uncharacterized membrane protein
VADLEGSESIEIDAPIGEVFAIAADVERAPEWQGTMKTAHALEFDDEGRPTLVETKLDAGPAAVKCKLRFAYDEPYGMTWERESGDLKGLFGRWDFEELDGDRTHATYSLEIDLNRALALLRKGIRGPAEDKVRHLLTHRPLEGLKERAESA